MESSSKGKSLYYQLVDVLKERIETQMTPHDKLLSEERTLSALWSESDNGSPCFARIRDARVYLSPTRKKEHMCLIYQISRLIWRERIVLQKR